MKKFLFLLVVTMLLPICLAGCECKHEWSEADCTTAQTCSKCGATQGMPLGHDWIEANCSTPQTCSRCGATQGEPEHKWIEATEKDPKTCSVCGETEGLSLKDQSYVDNIESFFTGEWVPSDAFYAKQLQDTPSTFVMYKALMLNIYLGTYTDCDIYKTAEELENAGVSGSLKVDGKKIISDLKFNDVDFSFDTEWDYYHDEKTDHIYYYSPIANGFFIITDNISEGSIIVVNPDKNHAIILTKSE